MNVVLFMLFVLAGPLVVEVVGYFWHRFIEHKGVFGEGFRYKHWLHHEKDYPTKSLRPSNDYKSAKSWSWYVLAVILIAFLLVTIPLKYSVPMCISGAIYARFGVSAMHASFHKKNMWLSRFKWYKRLVRLHDIHHYKPVNYGINFFFMDKLFGTYSETMPAVKTNTFPKLDRKRFETKLNSSVR